jgi:lysophospholipase L1-like esterase
MTARYVALGCSMAAGPGIAPGAPGAPWAAGRSARNYAHLVAAALDLDLVDVTYSGATTSHILRDKRFGSPPQIDALDGSESLVTVTAGGNDVGHTAHAAEVTGCELVEAGRASRDHHAWSADPWTRRFGLPLPGRPAPLHPNAAGMRAVADLVARRVRGLP